tara:strand:- start:44 stop:286 length:243 start_codon:yes stop_codon:yes gene_type:complete
MYKKSKETDGYKYTWSEDTLDYFNGAMFWKTASELHEEIQEFVRWNCQLEEDETEQDLIDDLHEALSEYQESIKDKHLNK